MKIISQNNEKSTKFIKCYCHPPDCLFVQSDKSNSDVCSTNVGCYRSITIEEDIISESYGCFKNNSNDLLMVCSVGEREKIKVKCCTDIDMCNKNLSMTFLENYSNQHPFLHLSKSDYDEHLQYINNALEFNSNNEQLNQFKILNNLYQKDHNNNNIPNIYSNKFYQTIYYSLLALLSSIIIILIFVLLTFFYYRYKQKFCKNKQNNIYFFDKFFKSTITQTKTKITQNNRNDNNNNSKHNDDGHRKKKKDNKLNNNKTIKLLKDKHSKQKLLKEISDNPVIITSVSTDSILLTDSTKNKENSNLFDYTTACTSSSSSELDRNNKIIENNIYHSNIEEKYHVNDKYEQKFKQVEQNFEKQTNFETNKFIENKILKQYKNVPINSSQQINKESNLKQNLDQISDSDPSDHNYMDKNVAKNWITNYNSFGMVEENMESFVMKQQSYACKKQIDKFLCEQTCTSGSGSGQPFLVEQTIAHQITLQQCIGQGRFGEVWRATFQDEDVAVKIFSSRDESSWVQETELYNRYPLRHENILGYYASDITSRNGCTQLWLITVYHPNGCLYDYLQNQTFDLKKTFQLAKSIACGLCYLHSSITGIHGKPSIVHRDIKSKNILVQSNGTCCIGDLGLAVEENRNFKNWEKFEYQVGTKRYMAPELLEEICSRTSKTNLNYPNCSRISYKQQFINQTNNLHKLNTFTFEILKSIDVYAFSLVLWEIFRRCEIENGDADEFMVPFGNMIQSDPTFDSMYQIICVLGARPPISTRWKNNIHVSKCIQLMEECWQTEPLNRLTMLRVKKSLSDLLKSL